MDVSGNNRAMRAVGRNLVIGSGADCQDTKLQKRWAGHFQHLWGPHCQRQKLQPTAALCVPIIDSDRSYDSESVKCGCYACGFHAWSLTESEFRSNCFLAQTVVISDMHTQNNCSKVKRFCVFYVFSDWRVSGWICHANVPFTIMGLLNGP